MSKAKTIVYPDLASEPAALHQRFQKAKVFSAFLITIAGEAWTYESRQENLFALYTPGMPTVYELIDGEWQCAQKPLPISNEWPAENPLTPLDRQRLLEQWVPFCREYGLDYLALYFTNGAELILERKGLSDEYICFEESEE